MKAEKEISAIFKKGSKVKPEDDWLERSRVWLTEEIEKEKSFSASSFFSLFSDLFFRNRALALAVVILLFLGATTVLAVYLVNSFGPRSDTFIGILANRLADEWMKIEALLRK